MYGGHQYAAVKLPDDKVCAFGNEYSLEYVDDYSDAIKPQPACDTAAFGEGHACPRKRLFTQPLYRQKNCETDFIFP